MAPGRVAWRTPRRWRPNERRVMLLVMASLAICTLSPGLYVFTAPWEQAYREDALPILGHELAALPAVNDASKVSSFVSYTANSTNPYIFADYQQPVGCDVVQAHYRQVGAKAGWDVGGKLNGVFELKRSMDKTADGYYLMLTIECAEGSAGTEAPSPSAVYSVLIEVPFPYSVAIIGTWLPKG